MKGNSSKDSSNMTLYKILTEKTDEKNMYCQPEWPAFDSNNTPCPREAGAACEPFCIFDVAADPSERHDLSKTPEGATVAKMLSARLQEISTTIWETSGHGYLGNYTNCTTNDAYKAAHEGFLGPLCTLCTNASSSQCQGGGPSPSPSPPSPSPGPFKPTNLTNCTYITGGIRPPHLIQKRFASSKEACCSLCGLNANCVASVFQIQNERHECHMHAIQKGAHVDTSQHNSSICVTGRAPPPHSADENGLKNDNLVA
jgi:hypothetical protein